MTVHHIGNRSTYDKLGRLKRFRVHTMCGRLLHRPQLVTDSRKATTCRSCLRVISACWLPVKKR